MTVGGSGFYTLMWKGKRMAYLQIDPQCPPYERGPGWVRTGSSHRDPELASFFELQDDPDYWLELMGEDDPLVALQREATQGDLVLFRITRTPMGQIRGRQHDLREVSIEDATPEGGGEQINVHGKTMSKMLRFKGLPQGVEI